MRNMSNRNAQYVLTRLLFSPIFPLLSNGKDCNCPKDKPFNPTTGMCEAPTTTTPPPSTGTNPVGKVQCKDLNDLAAICGTTATACIQDGSDVACKCADDTRRWAANATVFPLCDQVSYESADKHCYTHGKGLTNKDPMWKNYCDSKFWIEQGFLDKKTYTISPAGAAAASAYFGQNLSLIHI